MTETQSLAKKIIRNTGILSISNGLETLCSYIIIVILAKVLFDRGLGEYSFIYAMGGICFVFSDLGLSYFLLKELPRNLDKKNEYFSNIITIKIILSCVSLLILFGVSAVLHKSPYVLTALKLAGVSLFFKSLSEFAFQPMLAFQKAYYCAIASISERFLALIIGVPVLLWRHSLVDFVTVLVVTNCIRMIVGFYYTSRFVRIKLTFNPQYQFSLIKHSIIFWFTFIFMYIYYRTDTVMISLMKGDMETGWYNAGYKLIGVMNLGITLLMVVIVPVMSNLYKTNSELLTKVFQTIFRFVIVGLIPICVLLFLLSDPIITFIYGSRFKNAVLILQILIWTEVFLFSNYLLGNYLNVIDKQKYFTFSMGIGAVVNILLNAVLIYKYSYIGAAIATFITQFLNFIFLTYFVHRFNPSIKISPLIAKPLISGIIIIVLLFKFTAMFFVYKAILICVLYSIFVLIFKTVTMKDYKLLKRSIF